jgi:hypothetical protein
MVEALDAQDIGAGVAVLKEASRCRYGTGWAGCRSISLGVHCSQSR